jgi:hypothetical protein
VSEVKGGFAKQTKMKTNPELSKSLHFSLSPSPPFNALISGNLILQAKGSVLSAGNEELMQM